MTDELAVKRQIEEAFADAPYPGDDQIAYDPKAWDGPELNEDFRGLHWRDVPRELLRHRWDDLPLFSPAGLLFYLPAYLVAAFDDLEIRDGLLSHFSVAADDESYAQQKYSLFSPAQKNAIKAFLKLWRDKADDDLTRRFWSEPLEKFWGRDWT